jgi:alpha-L-fucosidase
MVEKLSIIQKKLTVFAGLMLFAAVVFAQAPPKPYGSLPNKAQLNWHETGMYCIIHFGVDTYTNKEWGFGDEDPAIVNPTKFDAMQIVGAAKAGGFKGVVIVSKHHDGLCIWPTKTTEHNITKTPWKNGKGDMVKEYQLACQKLGMQLGLYCSPWDRNNPYYGTPKYLEIYRAQVKELYTNYGPIFISWHDGANGGDGFYGGKREERKIDRTTYYDWDNTWAMIRKWQPNAAIFGDIGADVRWVGNEEGEAGQTSWATYSPQAPDAGKKPSNGYSKYWEATEGTRHGNWMPAECDVPLRPGWFYHASQNEQVKTPYQLLELYYKSVGRGAALDLGLSPNKLGLLDDSDVASLKKFGELLKQTFAVNLLKGASFTASNIRGNNKLKFGPALLTDDNRYSYWASNDEVKTPSLVADMHGAKTFNVIRLRENIKLGQRINSVAIDAFIGGEWKEIATATSIGANRLIRLPQNITASKVRLRITGAEACVALSDFGLFKEPAHLTTPTISRDKKGMVTIGTDAPVSSIRYTVGGSVPTAASPIYQKAFSLANGGIVKAVGFEGNKASEVSAKEFSLSKAGWKVLTASPQADAKPEYAIDEDNNSTWNTLPKDTLATAQFPQELSIDLGASQNIKAFTYLPRQDKKTAGIADRYIFYTSTNGQTWQQAAAGEFSNIQSNPIEQTVPLGKPVSARYFKFSVLHVTKGNGVAVAELGVKANY